MKVPPFFELVRERDFRILWTGQTVSWLGGWTQSVAQGWLVWSLTKSPGQLALTAIMVSLPALLFSLLGGVTADLFGKRPLLVLTQAASMVPAAALGILTLSGHITAPRVLALVFLQGVLNAFDVPARQAFLAELVPEGRLQQAIALNSVSFNATRMLGPALAGLAIAGCGAAPCFFMNAASFAVGAASLLALRHPGSHNRLRPHGHSSLPLQELKDGFALVLQEREIRRSLLLVAMVSLFGIPFVPLLPVFAEGLGVGARGLGVMSACTGGGSVLAALALAWGGGKCEQRWSAATAGSIFAAALLVFARSREYPLSLLALVVAGAAVVVFLALINGLIHKSSPHALRGRVMGAYAFALLGMAPLGSALMGGLAMRWGATGALALSASACLASLVLITVGDLFVGRHARGREHRRHGKGAAVPTPAFLADEAL